MRAADLALAPVLLVALLLTACGPDPVKRSFHDDGVVVTPPTAKDVQAAVDHLGADVARLYKGRWPQRFPVSRDFSDQPLVVLLRIEDRGQTSADTIMLDNLLEQAVREQGFLRLYVDEVAVPPSLREDYPPPDEGTPIADQGQDVDAGLHLEGWIDRAGRFRLLLRDAVRDKPLLRSVSD